MSYLTTQMALYKVCVASQLIISPTNLSFQFDVTEIIESRLERLSWREYEERASEEQQIGGSSFYQFQYKSYRTLA